MSSEEVELLSDSKYRQFIAAVEKALRSFESTSEWADLISALGKLNKVLNSYSKFVVIPRKLMIGKRLSQCMHPALPSGVHLKALETYNLIFQRIGKKRLSQDLFIYSVGLFPLMSHSAMSVKPVLMKLYEEHFLPLGVTLVPSLPGLLLGLLPGIEEGSEYTERTISLLESFSVATDIDVFFDALWQSVITTPAVRLPATIFLLSQLDKHLPPTQQQHLLGKNHAFMVQGLCLALNDSLALVQRNVLDFLVQLLPLHAPNLSHTQLSTIMTAALGVLLRRDMSLNRRLYAWILATNGQSQISGSTSEDDGNQYFEMFGKSLVVEGMKALFRQQSSPGVDAMITKKATKLELIKPFRILLNLLDKPEIGSAILEDILIEVFKNLFFSYQHFNPKFTVESKHGSDSKPDPVKLNSKENPMEELIKTGNLLFNTFEPYFMWQYIAKLLASCNRRVESAESHVPTKENDSGGKISNDGEVGEKDDGDKLEILDVIRLTEFILNIVALESSVETESKHWPELLCQIIQELTKGCEHLTLDELEEGVLLCSKLLSKLTPSTNFVRDTSAPFSRNLASPSLSPTNSEFDLTDSIEYDSRTFEDSVESTSSRDNGMATNQTRDELRNKFESHDSFESRDSIGSCNDSASPDITTASRDQRRDITVGSHVAAHGRDGVNGEENEAWSSNIVEHVTGKKFKTPKFEKSNGDLDGGNTQDKMSGGKNGKYMKVEEETKTKGKVKSETDRRKNEKVKESKRDGSKKEIDEKMKEKHKKEKRRVKERSKIEKGEPRFDVEKNLEQHKNKNNEELVKHDSQSMLIRKCIDHFMNFILEFFTWKIFRTEKAMEILTNDKFSHFKQIDMCDKACSACIRHLDCSCNVPSRAAKTYTAMCKLLVELSCFPMQDKGTDLDGTVAKGKGSLPLWLRCLLVCCYQVNDFDIQSTSVATVLDLINLTLSVSPGVPSASVGVIVIPVLTLDEVMVIEKSDIYKVIANSLWSILGRPLPIHHRRAVELLIQLHNLTPSPHLCENVIGSSMVSADKESRLEALKRFANLWHIAKSILSQNIQGRTARGLRTFDRSLFVMLDGLESEEPEIRSLTKMWVSHSLEQGDIGRILEPLLLLLLHPSTARVSHFYCEREKKRKRESGTEMGKDEDAVGELVDDEVQDGILEDVDAGLEGSKEQPKIISSNASNSNTAQAPQPYIRPSDMHKLHYSGKCDYHRILYAFRTLSGVLRVVPRQFVCASAATSIGSSFGPYEERIKELLIRHKRSLLGKGFYGPLFGGKDENTDTSTKASPIGKFTIKPNTSKYLEILITITLYFIRSHYLPSSNVSPEFLEGNVKTQVSSLECLSNLTWELVKLVRESGHGFGNFITDLLSRCRVQKAIIHCLAATVIETRENSLSSQSPSESLPGSAQRSTEETVDQMILQSKLLEVVESLIVLEHALLSCIEALTPDHHGNSDFEIIMKGGEDGVGGPNIEEYASRFIQGKSLSSQEMLLNMVLCCLKTHGNFEMSSRWTGFVIECLPYLGMDLKKWVVPVVLQMCSNISDVTTLFKEYRNGQEKCPSSRNKQYPPDHLLAVLAGLTSICHFCLLDAVSSPVFTIQPRAGNTVGSPGADSGQKPVRSMQIFANLLHAFSSNSKSSDSSIRVENPTPLLEAREGLLSVLPKVIGTLLSLWGAWNLDNPNESLPSSMALLGTPKALRQNILQLLTPIAMTHTIVFLASVADVWNIKKLTEKDLETKSHFFLAVSGDQFRVISLVLDIKALSLEVVIDTVRQILHQELTNRDKGFEASLLQFFHEFLQRSPINHITQAKSSFLALLKDGLQLNLPPPAVFLLLVNLHTYCVKVPGKEDRKSRKETQDVAQRLIESCTSIAGLSLGSSAWFSRNLSVITLPETTSDETSPESESDTLSNDVKHESPYKPASSNNNAGKHSTQALIVLADILASLLDILFGSEEKERVVNFLINVMGNVTPYLRNHSVANVPNFRACCSLVASLSGYQYTRKAWRKETFELFFEASFFQMDSECVGNWRIIIDNLFTQDQASFRELMARATVTSSTTISIFGNQEQEMQQRALMLKRLSFAVFSSEPDQYQSFLPEMQERLAECLRMPQVPVLHEQVFLFFRVLLLRMSDNMTSIWPMIISEMIHVFLLMESDLLQADTPSRDQQMFYSETVLGASGYVNYSQEKWLGLYLSVCKLLDMALCLPPEMLPQFQMYRWAFEGAASETAGSLGTIFRPYVSRITKLLTKRKNIYVTGKTLECHAGRPLLKMYQLESVDELLPFLRMLSKEGRILLDMHSNEKSKTRRFKTGNHRNYLEKLIEQDFLDPLVSCAL